MRLVVGQQNGYENMTSGTDFAGTWLAISYILITGYKGLCANHTIDYFNTMIHKKKHLNPYRQGTGNLLCHHRSVYRPKGSDILVRYRAPSIAVGLTMRAQEHTQDREHSLSLAGHQGMVLCEPNCPEL